MNFLKVINEIVRKKFIWQQTYLYIWVTVILKFYEDLFLQTDFCEE